MENKIQKCELILIFVLVIFSFIYRMIFLYTPLDRDEGAYAYIAERLEKGELPYRDIFDHKQPFIYYIYKTAFNFFGKTDEAIRMFTNFYLILTFLLFYSFIRVAFNKWISLLALFIFILHINNHNLQGLNSNAEIFLIMPLLIAFILLYNSDSKYFRLNLFLSGFFIGVAVFIKLMAVFILFVPVFYVIRYIKRNKFAYLTYFFSGFLFFVFLLFIWILKNNITKEFIECNFFYNFNYLSQFDFKNKIIILLKGGIEFIKTNFILFIGFLYGIYKIFINKKNHFVFISFMSVIMFYISIFLLSGLYPHYYLVLIPFLSILSAILVNDIYNYLFKIFKNNILIILLLLSIIFLYFLYFVNVNNTYSFIKGNYKTMAIFYEARAVAEIININKSKEQSVFVFANEPEIYFYTHTKAPTKYIYNYPVNYKLNELNFISDFLVMEKETVNIYNEYINKNYKKMVEFKNLILFKKEGDKNEKNK